MSNQVTLSAGWSALAEEVDAELMRARAKFPSSYLVTTALTEEHGEAIRAVLEHYYEYKRLLHDLELPMYKGAERKRLAEPLKALRAAVRREIVQTMAMCIRLEMEGDEAHGLTGAAE